MEQWRHPFQLSEDAAADEYSHEAELPQDHQHSSHFERSE